MTAATVTVRGQAVVPGVPDEARFSLEVASLESKPEAALAEAAMRMEALEGVFSDLGIPAERRSTAGVSVGEQWEWIEDQKVLRGYRATGRVLVRLMDASLSGRLMREAAERAEARIAGPWWWIAPDNPARLEACKGAAVEARRKAEAYAEALGLRLGAVVSITEPGTEAEHVSIGGQAMAAMAPAEAADVPVGAGLLDVVAAVDVAFLLDQA